MSYFLATLDYAYVINYQTLMLIVVINYRCYLRWVSNPIIFAIATNLSGHGQIACRFNKIIKISSAAIQKSMHSLTTVAIRFPFFGSNAIKCYYLEGRKMFWITIIKTIIYYATY